MPSHHPQSVEDYTTANMVLIFVNMLWIFVVIWSYWGLVPVLIAAACLNHLITRLDNARRSRDDRFDRA